MADQDAKEPRYTMTPDAHDAIVRDMVRRGWTTTKGSPEWTKLSNAMKAKTGRSATRQAIKSAVETVGGSTALLPYMLRALELPPELAMVLSDVDRLLLNEVHEGGILQLTPTEQKEVAAVARRHAELLLRASGRKK